MSGPAGGNGGAVAIRGFLVQTLVALLDIAQAETSFLELRLEPPGVDEFDFAWDDATGTTAVQVKSTANEFRVGDVKRWAGELQAARKTETCRLVLVGNYHIRLAGINQIGDWLSRKGT